MVLGGWKAERKREEQKINRTLTSISVTMQLIRVVLSDGSYSINEKYVLSLHQYEVIGGYETEERYEEKKID